MNVIQGASLAGAEKIIVIDLVPSKLAFAQQFGATHSIDAGEGDPIVEIRSLTDGLEVDYAFEAIGTATTYVQTVHSIRN